MAAHRVLDRCRRSLAQHDVTFVLSRCDVFVVVRVVLCVSVLFARVGIDGRYGKMLRTRHDWQFLCCPSHRSTTGATLEDVLLYANYVVEGIRFHRDVDIGSRKSTFSICVSSAFVLTLCGGAAHSHTVFAVRLIRRSRIKSNQMHFLVHESNPQHDVRRTQSNAQLSSFCTMGCARGCTRLYRCHAHPPANGALRKWNTIPTTGQHKQARTQSRRRDNTETQRSCRPLRASDVCGPTTPSNTSLF